MKIKFPIIIDFSNFIDKVIEQLSLSFNSSIFTYQGNILENLRNKNIEDALKNMDDLRKALADMDFCLENYYGSLIEYQKAVLESAKKE